MCEKDNLKLLIKIILYLLLTLAFFSNYVIKSGIINFDITPLFLFGIFALVCLYIGYSSDWGLNRAGKAIGYVSAGAFILTWFWFILNIMVPDRNFLVLLNPISSTAIWWALLIPLIFLVLYLIINHKKFKQD